MIAPCAHLRTKVIDSRLRADGIRYRRTRCLDCGHRWTSFEVPVDDALRRGLGWRGSVIEKLLAAGTEEGVWLDVNKVRRLNEVRALLDSFWGE